LAAHTRRVRRRGHRAAARADVRSRPRHAARPHPVRPPPAHFAVAHPGDPPMVQRSRKPRSEPRDRGPADADPVLDRLRRHLALLGLTRTLDELDERLAWAARERPGATALLEHVLGAEAAHKLEQRVSRRIDTSGLVERKTLEAFDWDFQASLDKA